MSVGPVDPVRDLEIIETEMKLADLESIQKRLEKNNKKNIDEDQIKILQSCLDLINNDQDLTSLKSEFTKKQLKLSGLLSLKPKIFVCNVDEQSVQNGNDYTKKFISKFSQENCGNSICTGITRIIIIMTVMIIIY